MYSIYSDDEVQGHGFGGFGETVAIAKEDFTRSIEEVKEMILEETGTVPNVVGQSYEAAKNALGHFAYILEGMKDLNSLRPYRVRLTADGENLDGEYLFGAVCNSTSTSIGGLMKLDPGRVVLDDGKFELLLIPNPKNAADLQNLVLALLNQNFEGQGLVFRHVSQLHLETAEELPWSLDGEYAPSVPAVDIVNQQGALRLLL